MDISKTVDFLVTYPLWFRYVVVIWIVSAAAILAGLLLLRTHAVQGPLSSEEPQIESPAGPPNGQALGMTFQQYADKHDPDRFLENQKFVESSDKKLVEWHGFVHNVSERPQGVFVTVNSKKDSAGMYATLIVPSRNKVEAFSFRKNDFIVFTGKLSLEVANFPTVWVSTMQLVQARPEG